MRVENEDLQTIAPPTKTRPSSAFELPTLQRYYATLAF